MVALLQASLIVYVLVNVIGHVPVAVPSELVTTKLASVVQLSEIVNPAASNAVTVVIDAGDDKTSQASDDKVINLTPYAFGEGEVVVLEAFQAAKILAALETEFEVVYFD